ncbi:MAG: DNA-3-methyladenine glycosylase [Candidatus Altimarinota bacterium]
MPSIKKIGREFFERPTLEVAENLLGKYLVVENELGKMVGEINEVESYIGQDDLASHAAVGRTKRNDVMFWRGGHAYVYFTYGMYHCLNFVTEKENFPAAVLIRSILPIEGITIMRKLREEKSTAKKIPDGNLSNGPGKVCQALGLNLNDNGVDIINSEKIYLLEGKKISDFVRTERIGISKGKDKLWRFYYGIIGRGRFDQKKLGSMMYLYK